MAGAQQDGPRAQVAQVRAQALLSSLGLQFGAHFGVGSCTCSAGQPCSQGSCGHALGKGQLHSKGVRRCLIGPELCTVLHSTLTSCSWTRLPCCPCDQPL